MTTTTQDTTSTTTVGTPVKATPKAVAKRLTPGTFDPRAMAREAKSTRCTTAVKCVGATQLAITLVGQCGDDVEEIVELAGSQDAEKGVKATAPAVVVCSTIRKADRFVLSPSVAADIVAAAAEAAGL